MPIHRHFVPVGHGCLPPAWPSLAWHGLWLAFFGHAWTWVDLPPCKCCKSRCEKMKCLPTKNKVFIPESFFKSTIFSTWCILHVWHRRPLTAASSNGRQGEFTLSSRFYEPALRHVHMEFTLFVNQLYLVANCPRRRIGTANREESNASSH